MKKTMEDLINKLQHSQEPCIKLKIYRDVLDENNVETLKKLEEEVKNSLRVSLLLSERDEEGKIPHHPYGKWYGAHWVLSNLADVGYPAYHKSLIPLRDQVLKWLLSKEHEKQIRVINGKVRRCASQEGNALYSVLKLGLANEKTEELAHRLIRWQWPDGGWNCDKNPEAKNSSFMESLIPLRALSLYGRISGDKRVLISAERSAEIFLKRKMFRRVSDGSIIETDFIKLHYPCYWRYDILFGLKVMAEAGFISDPRCKEALDLLESKRLPDGGFPAEGKYYRLTDKQISGKSLVDWGGISQTKMNEFVTLDALWVLKKAGRV